MIYKFCQNITNDIKMAGIMTLFFVCIYIGFLNDNMSHAYDSFTYFDNILSSPEWHGNHLIYAPTARLWYDVMRPVIPISLLSDWKLISMMNAIFGAMTMGLLYLFARRRFDMPVYYAILTILCCGFSFYYLTFSTTIEIYIPAFFWSFSAFYVASPAEKSHKQAVCVGILHALAMIFHQMTFLFGVVIAWQYLHKKHYLLTYILTGTLIVMGAYLYGATVNHINNIPDFLKFMQGYLDNQKIISDNQNNTPLMSLYGLGTALLGGRYLMSIPPFKDILNTHFADHSIERIIYLHHHTGMISGTIQIISYVIFSICLILCIRHFIKHCIMQQHYAPFIKYFAVLCVMNTIFFMFWFAHNPEFWGIPMICLIFIIISSRPPITLCVMMTVSLMLINVLGTAIPLLSPDNDYVQAVKN